MLDQPIPAFITAPNVKIFTFESDDILCSIGQVENYTFTQIYWLFRWVVKLSVFKYNPENFIVIGIWMDETKVMT